MSNYSLLPPTCYAEYYRKILSNWDELLDCGHILTILIPPDFVNYSSVAQSDNGGAPTIWRFFITDNVVLAVLSFLAAACNDAVGVPCMDSWMDGNGRGFLVPARTGVRRDLNNIGFCRFFMVVGLTLSLLYWQTVGHRTLVGHGLNHPSLGILIGSPPGMYTLSLNDVYHRHNVILLVCLSLRAMSSLFVLYIGVCELVFALTKRIS